MSEPQPGMAFANVRIWDGVSAGYLEADSMVVEAGRITRIGGRAPGARDMSGLAVLPGLIDAHVHMVLDPDVGAALDQSRATDADIEQAMRERAGAMLRAGITTARDLGGGKWQELALRDAIGRGEVVGPRLICAGQPVTSPGGHCYFWGGEAANLAEAVEVIDRQARHGVDLIKVMATGGNLTPNSRPADAQYDAGTLTGIVAEARRRGYQVAAHCHGTAGIRNAVAARVRTVEHCSWVGDQGWAADFDEAVATALAEHGIFVSPTVNYGWRRHLDRQGGMADRVRENFRRMREAGVRLIASTDAGIPNVRHEDLGKALPVFAALAGLSNLEVLRSATSDSAEAIGLGGVTGRIAPGFSADLLFVDGDPLADLSALQAPACVVARGRIHDA